MLQLQSDLEKAVTLASQQVLTLKTLKQAIQKKVDAQVLPLLQPLQQEHTVANVDTTVKAPAPLLPKNRKRKRARLRAGNNVGNRAGKHTGEKKQAVPKGVKALSSQGPDIFLRLFLWFFLVVGPFQTLQYATFGIPVVYQSELYLHFNLKCVTRCLSSLFRTLRIEGRDTLVQGLQLELEGSKKHSSSEASSVESQKKKSDHANTVIRLPHLTRAVARFQSGLPNGFVEEKAKLHPYSRKGLERDVYHLFKESDLASLLSGFLQEVPILRQKGAQKVKHASVISAILDSPEHIFAAMFKTQKDVLINFLSFDTLDKLVWNQECQNQGYAILFGEPCSQEFLTSMQEGLVLYAKSETFRLCSSGRRWDPMTQYLGFGHKIVPTNRMKRCHEVLGVSPGYLKDQKNWNIGQGLIMPKAKRRKGANIQEVNELDEPDEPDDVLLRALANFMS